MRSMMFGEEPESSPSAPEPSPTEVPPLPAPSAEEPMAALDTVSPAPSVPAEREPLTTASEPVTNESEPVAAGSVAEEPSFAFPPLAGEREVAADAPESVAASQPEMTFDAAPPQASAAEDGGTSGAATSEWEPHDVEPSADAGTVEPDAPLFGAEAGVSDEAVSPSHQAEPEAAAAPSPIEAEAGTRPPSTPTEEPKPSAGTMVIIEDDASVAEYYATLFRGNGYRVEVAHDGVSGVDLCVRVEPDVILLDVMMPRQNGILVLQTLRASDETRNTPVVVLSNFSEPTLIKRALQLGALEYVIKTQVEGAALLQAVPRWMSRERAFAAA